MAGGAADLVHFDQQGISVTVKVDFLDLLHVATFFALAPQLIATAAEIADTPRTERFLVGVGIHVRQHQHVVVFGILSNDRNQLTLFKIGTTHTNPRFWVKQESGTNITQ